MSAIFSNVILGEWRLQTDPDCHNCPNKITRGVRKVIVHENYENSRISSEIRNDIALIRLDEAVPLSSENPKVSAVSPICLPWKTDDSARNLDYGDYATVTGWGRVYNNYWEHYQIKTNLGAGSRVLQKATLAILHKATCSLVWGRDTEKIICAGNEKG